MFATCSFAEYRPEMGGIPVRSSNGKPRYDLAYPLEWEMPSTFPDWAWVLAAQQGRMGRGEFFTRYIDKVRRNERRILDEAAEIRAVERADDDVPIVLLCFEQLAKKPGIFCHREAFRLAWRALHPAENVIELSGPMR